MQTKLNSRSSTETKLVAIDDTMGQILWTWNFLNGQGINTTNTNYIYQDNKSTILLDENGKGSSSRRTRHLDVRYFFVTDKIKKGKVKVTLCPTHDMLGDFFTKPLQRTQFVHMRSKILNLHRSVFGSWRDLMGLIKQIFKFSNLKMQNRNDTQIVKVNTCRP